MGAETTKFDEDTFAGAQATVRHLAAESFSRHILETVGEREWWCHRERSGYYSFRVIIRRGTVVIFGDIGTGIFQGGEAGDTVAWLREAVHSPSYLLSKLQRREYCFRAGDALAFARERAEEGSAAWSRVLAEALRLAAYGELGEHTWAGLVLERTQDAESCAIGRSDDGEALWLVEALRWLVEHLDAERPAETAEVSNANQA